MHQRAESRLQQGIWLNQISAGGWEIEDVMT